MIKRKCFAVLLIIVLVVQKPFLMSAGSLEENGVFLNEETTYSHTEEYKTEELENIDEFQLSYHLDGGENSLLNPSLYKREDLPVVLEAPVREGYNFAGWYTDSAFHHKIAKITEETLGHYDLYAKWTDCIDDVNSVQMYAYKTSSVVDGQNKLLKDCNYDFLSGIEIPGMPSTRERDVRENRITDTSQCPQGICFADEYILVSSYSTEKREHLGCIHVFDQRNGEYLVTLGMKEESHLGGLAFDGKNIWVCHSDNNTLEAIPYSFIQRAASYKSRQIVDCSNLFKEYRVANSPSCIAFHEGKLWVATHTRMFNSEMIAYELTENGLEQREHCRIPEKVQGIAFDSYGQVYMSTSYGRTKSSYLKVYASLKALNVHPEYPAYQVEMPPCSEAIALEEEQIYVLFESAGEMYFEGTDGKGTSVSPIEKIMTIAKSSIFS